jgi:hypothetical protein
MTRFYKIEKPAASCSELLNILEKDAARCSMLIYVTEFFAAACSREYHWPVTVFLLRLRKSY